jgi:hypothetical protein
LQGSRHVIILPEIGLRMRHCGVAGTSPPPTVFENAQISHAFQNGSTPFVFMPDQ